MTGKYVRVAVAAAACNLLAAPALGARSTAPYDWTSYSGGDTMANSAPSSTITPETAPQLGVRWSRQLDGAVYASPLYARTGVHEPLVLVATMGDTLWALSAANGAVVWKRSLGPPVATVCHGEYGIASTPAIDTGSGRVYVIGAGGRLWSLSLSTGRPEPGWPLRIVDRTSVEFAWSGLRLHDGLLYVNVASYCDLPDARGRSADGYTVAVDVAQRKVAVRLDVVPGPANMGGAWGWGGVSVAPDGSIYLATGNAAVVHGPKLVEDAPMAESIVHLTRRLKVLSYGRPPDKSPDNLGDEDFGSTPLLFQPSGCPSLLSANSKNGFTYVWRREDLAHPLWKAPLGPTNPDEPFLAQPSWDPVHRLLVVTSSVFGSGTDPSRGVSAFRPNAACTSFVHVWDSNVGGGPQPPALIVGGVVVSAVASQGMLYAFDVRSGAILWRRQIDPSQAPIATNGQAIFVGDTSGRITVYQPR